MSVATLAPSTDELAALTPEDFVGLLRAELTKPGCGMADHPIVAAMEDGSITVPQLVLFCEQFYLHISRMLPWIGAIYVNCPHEDVRTTLVKNLAEECMGIETGTKAHPELLLEWGAALGGDVDAMRRAEQLPAGRRLTEYFEFMGLCRDWCVPLAAIGIGLESFVPDTFTRIVAAQKQNFGMSEEDLIFWTMHILADAEHGDEGIEIVSEYARTPEQRDAVYHCTLETGRLFYDMWNVYRTVPA